MKNKNVLRTLKKVITLDKAAQYLSHSLDSKITVTEDDILRYAFEGSITLSVELVKPMFAKMGRLVSRKEVEIHYTEVERLKEMPHELILSVLQRHSIPR